MYEFPNGELHPIACVTDIERARKTLREDRQGSFGDNVWAETVPLVPI